MNNTESPKNKFKVDNAMYETDKKELTGREILIIAGYTPPENYRIDMQLKGGETKKIELDVIVDISEPGLEKFMTIKLGPQEG